MNVNPVLSLDAIVLSCYISWGNNVSLSDMCRSKNVPAFCTDFVVVCGMFY